ncbi:MAG: hypothetical protein ACRC0J_23010 [Shewanella oncorhynchi]
MAAQFGQQLAQALQNQEFTKLPFWHNDPKYDTFKAEDWWTRFEFAAEQGGWDWVRTQGNFMNCMRGNAIKWYKALSRFYVLMNRAELKERFLADFASTANNRASIADVKIQQGSDSVITFWGKLNQVYDDIELTVPAPVIPAAQDLLLVESAAQGAANLAHVNGLALAQLQADYRAIELRGYRRSMAPLFRAYFIAGLNPKIQDEVLRANPATPEAALEVAKRAEKDFLLKSNSLAVNEVDEKEENDHEVDALRRGRPHRGAYRGRGRGPRGHRGGQTRPSTDKSNSLCFYCNKKGHWQRECRKRISENGAMKSKAVAEVEEYDNEADPAFLEALHALRIEKTPEQPASENW